MAGNDYVLMPAGKERRLRIDNFFKGLNVVLDESVLEPKIAGLSYNFDFSSGALTDGYGVETLFNNSTITNIWRYNKGTTEIFMFSTDDGEIYYINEIGSLVSLGVRIFGKLYTVNYRLYGEDVILICSGGNDMLVWNGVDTPYSVAASPRVISMAAHSGRLIVIESEGNILRYSMDLDPTNWNNMANQGGIIELGGDKGKLNKVISFLNYTYVFRDYGISRVSFSASGEPIVTDLYVSSGKIYADTAHIAGDRVIFLCSDGLYIFDGLSTKRVLTNLTGAFLPSANACATYYNGQYYLAVRLNLEKFDDEVVGCESEQFVNNGLLVYDHKEGGYCISRGIDIRGFCMCFDKLLTLSGRVVGVVVKKSVNLTQPLIKKWRSVFTDLGSEQIKRLSRIHLESNAPLKLSVNADNEVADFDFNEGEDSVRVNMRGKKLGFCISCSKLGAKISRPVLVLSE